MERRTIRRFSPEPVGEEALLRLVDAGRMAASAGNRQPWRFVVVRDPDRAEALFHNVAWLPATGDPPEGQQPTAYLVILAEVGADEADRQERVRRAASDCAAAAQNVCLMAHALGLGACWIGSVHRDNCRMLLGIPPELEIYAVIALGFPAESAMAEEVDNSNSVSAYRGEDGVVHVPKLRRDAVMRRLSTSVVHGHCRRSRMSVRMLAR
jgi:nitroreductase